MEGKDAEHEAVMAEFRERIERTKNEPVAPLDPEAVLTAYAERYGKEAAEEERKRGPHPARLRVLAEVLKSGAWMPER
jgi:hypothetical protein